MAITIGTGSLEDEAKYAAYIKARTAVSQTVAHAVYPGLLAAMRQYTELAALVAASSEEMQEHDAAVSAPVSSHIATMLGAAQLLISTVEGIEKVAPGTFGITIATALPVPAPAPELPEVP